MWYHYGRHALAAMIHRVSPCSLVESLFCIVGGVGKIALALSAMAFGSALGAFRQSRLFAGLFAVFGVFFVGWISWPLTLRAEPYNVRLPIQFSGFPPEHWEPFQHILHAASGAVTGSRRDCSISASVSGPRQRVWGACRSIPSWMSDAWSPRRRSSWSLCAEPYLRCPLPWPRSSSSGCWMRICCLWLCSPRRSRTRILMRSTRANGVREGGVSVTSSPRS